MTERLFASRVSSLVVLALLILAPAAQADLPPIGYSTADLVVRHNWPLDPCPDADLIWAPAPPSDSIVIYVTVRNEFANPVPGCDVRLDLGAVAAPDPNLGSGTGMGLCGSAYPLSWTATTDADGTAEFPIRGGGCGRIALDWTLTALCASPEIEIWNDSDTLCAKSMDLNGDLHMQFVDTFKFLPMLSSGSGWCGDFNCDGEVSFPDVFRFLPLIGMSSSCAGVSVPQGNLGSCE